MENMYLYRREIRSSKKGIEGFWYYHNTIGITIIPKPTKGIFGDYRSSKKEAV